MSNQKTLFVPRDNVIFHSIPRVLRVPWNIFCISWQHACVPRVAMKYKIYFMARVGFTNFKITKIWRDMPKRLMWLMNQMKKVKEFCSKKDAQNTKKSTKFATQTLRAFGDLQTAEESVKNLDKRLARFFANYFFIFFMNILVFRYNISFIDPPRG